MSIGIRIVLWAVFLAILGIMWGREVIVLGEARREGRATQFDFRRFRRRTLGLFLLLVLGVGMDFSTWLQWESPWQTVGFYGIFFILFIWLLIVAARDLRATVMTFERERQGVAMEAIEEMRRVVARRASRADDQPIPLMDFTGRPRDGSSAHVRKPDFSEESASDSSREQEAEEQKR
jgi:hypothetical protein